MSGINWLASTREKFDKIVEILLRREFGLRGHAVNGRGGDGGIDYDVDDAKIIFQLKFFPDGFASNDTRKRQIRKSFNRAMEHDPDEWTLVVPATLTPGERRFVTGLSRGKKVKIKIRDATWLDDQLMREENRSLLDHYLHASDIDYLHARAEAFKNNPVVRDTRDVADRVRAIQDAVDLVDPNWTLGFASVGGEVVQTLVPRDLAAPERAPVTIKFTAVVPKGSPEQKALAEAHDYGLSDEIRLPGHMVQDYKVEGTRLLQSNEPVEELRLGALPGPFKSQLGEMILTGPAGERMGVWLVDARQVSRAARGYVVEAKMSDFVTWTLRIPYNLTDQDGSSVHYQFEGAEGRSITDLFEAADFMVKLNEAATCELRINGNHVIGMATHGHVTPGLLDQFTQLRLLTDDLGVIEAAANTRFRMPAEILAKERAQIRNVRLMLEGHCVAHPTDNQLTVQLEGTWHDSLDQFLTTDPGWILLTAEPGQFEILRQTIVLPQVTFVALVHLTQEEVDAARRAFDEHSAEGHPVVLRTREHDRVRMFLPDRRDPNLPLDITPWNVVGLNQMGLDPEGRPLAELDTNQQAEPDQLPNAENVEDADQEPVAEHPTSPSLQD